MRSTSVESTSFILDDEAKARDICKNSIDTIISDISICVIYVVNAISSAASIVPSTTKCPPVHTITIVVTFIASVTMGIVVTTIFKARSVVFIRSSLAVVNFSVSKSCRTNDFITRTFVIFSCIPLFRLSSFFCIARKRGNAVLNSRKTIPPSIGIIIRRIVASRAFIEHAIIIPPISIPGDRIAIIRSIRTIFCIWVMSLVRRVTSEPVEKLSMFLKENFCTFSNKPCLKSLLKYTDARIEK